MTAAAEDHERSVRIGIAGYGYWGPNLARNVAAGERCELSVICEKDEGSLGRAGRMHPGARLTADWQELIEDPGVDALILALPIALHHRFALEALRAGKHVLVEKPLATSVAECDELAAEAARRDLVLMVGHTFEYSEAVRAVGRYLAAGELGDPYYISMRRTNLGIVRSDANALWNLAPHDISILCSWLGKDARRVTATGAAWLQDGIEDVVFLSIEFEGGVLGHVHCSWLDPNKIREATIVGSQKMAVYDDVSPDEKIRIYDKGVQRSSGDHPSMGAFADFGRFQMLARAGDVLIPKIEMREPLAVQTEHFAECIREGLTPLTGPANGRRTVAILEAAQRSLASGGGAVPAGAAAEEPKA
ncbi:MAG: Gfo/Idh/MocA family oxidoreductase [Thermoleophilaceae bacterium]